MHIYLWDVPIEITTLGKLITGQPRLFDPTCDVPIKSIKLPMPDEYADVIHKAKAMNAHLVGELTPDTSVSIRLLTHLSFLFLHGVYDLGMADDFYARLSARSNRNTPFGERNIKYLSLCCVGGIPHLTELPAYIKAGLDFLEDAGFPPEGIRVERGNYHRAVRDWKRRMGFDSARFSCRHCSSSRKIHITKRSLRHTALYVWTGYLLWYVLESAIHFYRIVYNQISTRRAASTISGHHKENLAIACLVMAELMSAIPDCGPQFYSVDEGAIQDRFFYPLTVAEDSWHTLMVNSMEFAPNVIARRLGSWWAGVTSARNLSFWPVQEAIPTRFSASYILRGAVPAWQEW